MSTVTTKRAPAQTVQQIIIEAHAGVMQDVAGFLAISAFIGALLLWAA